MNYDSSSVDVHINTGEADNFGSLTAGVRLVNLTNKTEATVNVVETTHAEVKTVVESTGKAEIFMGGRGERGFKGEQGDKGGISPVSIGEVTTLDPGNPVEVTDTGELGNVVLNFGIPRGVDGLIGSNAIVAAPDAPTDPENGQLWYDTDATADTLSVLSMIYPVGSIYMNKTVATNPATLFGFGTWVAITDRAIFGKGSGTFANAGATGGAETVALTGMQIPPLQVRATSGGYNGDTVAFSTGGAFGGWGIAATSNNVGQGTLYANASADNNPSRTATAHNNLPPYIVAYMWERTA